MRGVICHGLSIWFRSMMYALLSVLEFLGETNLVPRVSHLTVPCSLAPGGGKMKDPVPIPKTFRFVLFGGGASEI